MRFLHLHSKHIKSSPLWWRLSRSNRRCAQTAYDQQGASGSLRAWTLRFPLTAHTQVTKSPTQSAQLIQPIANPVSWTPAIQKNQVSLGAGRWLMQLQCSNVNTKRNVIKCSPNTGCPRSRRHQQQEANFFLWWAVCVCWCYSLNELLNYFTASCVHPSPFWPLQQVRRNPYIHILRTIKMKFQK